MTCFQHSTNSRGRGLMNKSMINSVLRLFMGGVSYYLISKGVDAGVVDNLNTVVTSIAGGTAIAGAAIAWSASDKRVANGKTEKVDFSTGEVVRPPKGYSLSARSKGILAEVDPRLGELFTTAIIDSPHDFTIYHGLRTQQEQNEMLRTRASRVQRSKHQDGKAVDIFIIGKDGGADWDDIKAYTAVANHVKACSVRLNIPIVWGGDWENLRDYVHFELI